MLQIFAHRGNSSEAPENTLAAFRAAQAVHAHGVEFDVQLTRDGVPVVIHDEQVDRTTNGKGWVRDLTLAQIQALDAGSWFDAKFAGERIPTLAQVLDLFRGSAALLNIELKTKRVPYPGLCAAVLREVEQRGMAGQAMVSSFNHESLKELQALAPRMECGVLLSDRILEPWDYARRHRFQALHLPYPFIDQTMAEEASSTGLRLRAWTVDDVPEGKRLQALGVAALITNQPRQLMAAFAG